MNIKNILLKFLKKSLAKKPDFFYSIGWFFCFLR